MIRLLLSINVLTLLLGTCLGFGQYREQIPNGVRVAHPCKPNTFWKGVGHVNAAGGATRNQFGKDFANAQHTWTRELCLKDSDGDGATNGYELGDPGCVWQKGDLPSRLDDITHPGVCTPYGSATCAGLNEWVDCSKSEIDCPAFDNADTQNITLRMPSASVPPQETTYMCMLFDIPLDQDYHMIGHKPIVGNDNVLHHMLLYGCSSNEEPLPTEGYGCDMGAAVSCYTLIGAWAIGTFGDCSHENVGMLFGKTNFKRFAIQYHWNNPKKVSGWHDSSGLTIYYTNQLRQYNGGVISTGEEYLEIPPATERTTYTSSCSSQCLTAAMNAPIYITSAVNHMHYLGASETIQLKRNGQHHLYITNEQNYSYDSPQFSRYTNPIQILPTDEIVTTCHYNSRYSQKYVYEGDGTSDEMCYGFLWYYPAEAMPDTFCKTYKSVELCAMSTRPVAQDGCTPREFATRQTTEVQKIFQDVNEHCNIDGACQDLCKTAVTEAMKHPCLKADSDIADYTYRQLNRDVEGLQFYAKLAKCKIVEDEVYSSEGANIRPVATMSFMCLVLYVLY